MRTISAPAQAFGFVETLHKPTEEQVEAVIEAMKDHADALLDWWDFEHTKYGAPDGNIDGLSIIATEFTGVATVALKYYFRSDRFREVRAFIKYQAENAPKWKYDSI